MSSVFFFNDTATTEIYTLSLHDALPISNRLARRSPAAATERGPSRPAAHPGSGVARHPIRKSNRLCRRCGPGRPALRCRSEEHTSELQSRLHLVCRLLLEKKNTNTKNRL